MMRLPPKIAARQAKVKRSQLPAGAAPRSREQNDAGAVVITLPRPPTPLLTMNRAIGMHWRVYEDRMGPWRDEVAWVAKAHRDAIRAMALPVTIGTTLRVAVMRRADPSNFSLHTKSMVDGLVHAGCLDDDSPAYVRTLEPVLLVDRTSQAVTLTIRPARTS